VFAATALISAAEYMAWAALGEPNELAPVALTTLGIALAAGAVTAFAARASRFGGLVLGLTIAWTPFASVGIAHALAFAAAFVVTAGLLWRFRPAVVGGITTLVWLGVGANACAQRPSNGSATSSDSPDIVLLVMDTTRSDHLSVYGYDKPTSPNLERFAEHARVYDDAWSVAPWTSPSHASMFTGLLPAEHGVDGALGISFPGAVPTLPEVLARAGYRTAGFPGNANLFAPGWERGFDVYLPAEYQKTHSLIRGLNDVARRWRDPAAHALGEQLLARARRWWDANDGAPRFLFVNLIEPHSPYIPSDELYDKFLGGIPREEAFAVQARMRPDGSASPAWTPRETDTLARLYDAEIAGMDGRIGEFVEWLDARGDLEDTLFVITSDHGERLGERGLIGHSLVMDPYLLRVPLLMSYPAELEPTRIPDRVQLDGLAGSILELAEIDAPDSMGTLAPSEVAVAQYRPPSTIVDDMGAIDANFDDKKYRRDWSFVASAPFALEWSRGSGPILTNLETDPNFTRNLATDHAELTRALLEIARALPRFDEAESRDVDPELMRHLKSLGYVR
jgi:arylsulfatase A-like enzyme